MAQNSPLERPVRDRRVDGENKPRLEPPPEARRSVFGEDVPGDGEERLVGGRRP